MTHHFSAAKWLNAESNYGYGTMPIPTPRDMEICCLLRSWLKLEKLTQMVELSSIPEEYRLTLLSYSERMASLAVREHNKEYIFLGLLALGLDGWSNEWRDNAALVCLHYNAAQRIGLPPNGVFEEVAKLLPPKPAEGLRSYLRRSEEDKSLQAMGYILGTDGDGFRYQRTW